MKVLVVGTGTEEIWSFGIVNDSLFGMTSKKYLENGMQSQIIEILEQALEQAKAQLSCSKLDGMPDISTTTA